MARLHIRAQCPWLKDYLKNWKFLSANTLIFTRIILRQYQINDELQH